MVKKVNSKDFLESAEKYCIVDVRSPKEYSAGHIPGAINIPLFTDDERAVVGTLYQKQGREPAIVKGLDIALGKVFAYVKTLKSAGPSLSVCIHCWRGGMRSEMMAEVFSKAGYKVFVLEGGYKAYRSFIRGSFSKKVNILVLGGFTGCGKSEILRSLAGFGEQVIDLENLASHKGSVFGALGQGRQPTNEQFENDLYHIWEKMDLRKRIWLEDESRSIGKVALPDPVFNQISNARLVKVELDTALRIERLVAEYARFDKELLADGLFRIREGLGGTRYKLALGSLEESDFNSVVSIVMEYYDKAYRKAIEKRPDRNILSIGLKGKDPRHHAIEILAIIKRNK